jgi:DNA polymerase V
MQSLSRLSSSDSAENVNSMAESSATDPSPLVATSVQPAAFAPPRRYLPLVLDRVRAGFPSPADGYVDRGIDLNEILIENPESSFFLRVEGHSMTGAGIHDGDVLLVDRAAEPKNGSVVIAAVDGQLTVKRLRIEGTCAWLLPAHPDFEPIELSGGQDLRVWGVVRHVIHKID